MKPDATEFVWDLQRHEAAQLIAEDSLDYDAIAAKVGVGRSTLWRWKQIPQFAARVEQIRAALGDCCLRRAIARRSARVRALDERWAAMHQVIAERAADPLMATIPGGKSGLLVIKEAELAMEEKDGKKTARLVVTEVAVDTGLLKELREHERQAAQELGQWADKHEHSGPDGGPMQTQVTVLPDDERRATLLAILAAGGHGPNSITNHGAAGGPALAGPVLGDDTGGDDAGPMADFAPPVIE